MLAVSLFTSQCINAPVPLHLLGITETYGANIRDGYIDMLHWYIFSPNKKSKPLKHAWEATCIH